MASDPDQPASHPGPREAGPRTNAGGRAALPPPVLDWEWIYVNCWGLCPVDHAPLKPVRALGGLEPSRGGVCEVCLVCWFPGEFGGVMKFGGSTASAPGSYRARGSTLQGRTGVYVGGDCRFESHFYALAERIRKLGDVAEMLDKSAEEEDVTVEACAKLFGIALAIVLGRKIVLRG